MKSILALSALALCGCASINPDMIKAMEGQSGSLCVEFPSWNGSQGRVHYASFGGKSTGTAGGGGKAACGASTVEFTNEGRQAPKTP